MRQDTPSNVNSSVETLVSATSEHNFDRDAHGQCAQPRWLVIRMLWCPSLTELLGGVLGQTTSFSFCKHLFLEYREHRALDSSFHEVCSASAQLPKRTSDLALRCQIRVLFRVGCELLHFHRWSILSCCGQNEQYLCLF